MRRGQGLRSTTEYIWSLTSWDRRAWRSLKQLRTSQNLRFFHSSSSVASASPAWQKHERNSKKIAQEGQSAAPGSFSGVNPPPAVPPGPLVENDERRDGASELNVFLVPLSRDPDVDLDFLVQNFTAPALASALRHRDQTLKRCAELMAEGKFKELEATLKPWRAHKLNKSADQKNEDETVCFSPEHLQIIKYRLNRMPRQVTNAVDQRASVLLPLCFYNGEPAVFFTKRSEKVRKHKSEVCFPGGMVDREQDSFIIQTCLRELEEETGIPADSVDVLGILRCDWTELTSLTGIAVTPVVGFLGELNELKISINKDEVDEWFTVPLRTLVDPNHWVYSEDSAPVFRGAHHVVWGLTAYILNRFVKDILKKSKKTVADGK